LVLNIGNKQSSIAVQKAIVRFTQLGLGARAAIAAEPGFSGAGHRANYAGGGVNFADGGVESVDDVYVAVGIHGKRIQIIHGRLCGQAAISRVTRLTGSRHRGDYPRVSIDAPDSVVTSVGYVQAIAGVERAPIGLTDQRLGGRAAVSGIALHPGPYNSLDLPNLKIHAYLKLNRTSKSEAPLQGNV
jgi:hypothetical protein